MRRRFFVERFSHQSATLTGDTANHLARVLRAEPGQLYELSDGSSLWLARIDEIGALNRGENRIEFSLVEELDAPELGLNLALLLSIVKFDRFEWCLEKATELGVSTIIPLAAERSDRALVVAAPKRYPRWERILHESAQQSRRLGPPSLAGIVTPAKAFTDASHLKLTKLLLSERRGAPSLRTALATAADDPEVELAIGPEGGWTDAELAAARAAGFAEASLGDQILRTETAVIASLAILQYAFAPS